MLEKETDGNPCLALSHTDCSCWGPQRTSQSTVPHWLCGVGVCTLLVTSLQSDFSAQLSDNNVTTDGPMLLSLTQLLS